MITTRAGEYAAEWTVESMPPIQRADHQGVAGVAAQARLLLRLGASAGAQQLQGSRAVSRVRRGTARIDVRASIFCTVREPVAASAVRLLRRGVHAPAGAVRSRHARRSASRAAAPASRACVLRWRWPTGQPKPEATHEASGARRRSRVLRCLALRRRRRGADRRRILVMPFENVTRDSRIFWLGEASAVLLADDLNALGANAITREERREAFERLQVPPRPR